MNVKPYPRDANDKPLIGYGSEFFTARIAVTTVAYPVVFGLDIKGFDGYVEAGSNDIYMAGNKGGSLVWLAASAFSSQAGGKVRITTGRDHLIPVGGTITLPTLADYTGTYVVTDVPSSTTLQFVATYVACTPAVTDYVLGGQDSVLSAGATFGKQIALAAFATAFTVRTATGTGTLTLQCVR